MFKCLPGLRQHLILKCGGNQVNLNSAVMQSNSAMIQTSVKLKSFEEIPGPKCYPVIGTLYKYFPLIGDYDAEALDKIGWLNYRRYGVLAKEVPGVRVLHVFDPEDIEAVFRQDDRYPARRSHVAMQHYRLNKRHVYNTGGLLSTNGPDWWRLRSTFQKNFTSPQSVKGHVVNTDAVAQEFIQWIKHSKVSAHDNFLTYLNRLYLEVIGVVAFNERFQSFSDGEQLPESRSSRTIAAAFGSNCGTMKLDKGVLWRFFNTPLYKKLATSQEYLEKLQGDYVFHVPVLPSFLVRRDGGKVKTQHLNNNKNVIFVYSGKVGKIHRVAQNILLEKVSFFENDDVKDESLLGSFLQQPNLDLKDITGMMVDILMASIDTTSYSTSFALYHLAQNPDCQEKVFKEASVLLPTKETALTPDTLSKAIYLRSCIKESLRLNPVSIGVGRLLQKDIVLKDYLIPEGTVIVAQNMISSRLPQYVSDPNRFKPERWLRGSQHYENLHPFLSLPFGFGPRSCIARRLAEQNMCIALIRILREFEIKWTGAQLGVQTLLINKPDKPVLLSFRQRNE